MRRIGILVLLLIPCLWIMACGGPQHGTDVKSGYGNLMQYDSVHQYGQKSGRVVQNLTLVGKAYEPAYTETRRYVLVPGTPSPPTPPPRPAYGRRAKAVPRTPPVSPPAPPKKETLVNRTESNKAEVLSSVGEGGPTTGHSVAAGLAYSVPAAGGFVAGNAVAPGTNIAVNAVAKGGKMTQGQATNNQNTNINPNTNINNPTAISGSSSSSSAAAAGN